MPSQQSAHVNEGTDKSIPLKEISQTLRSSDESTILDNSVNRQKTPPSGTILWLQVLACFCVHFVTGGWAGCAGLFQIHYTKSLHKSAHDVAWITGLETFFTFVPSALVGRLCDLGYLKSSMFLGNLFLSVGGLVISWGTQNIDMLIAVQGVVMGIAKCLVWIPSTFIICTYFEDKRLPVALAVIHAGSAIGSLIFPIILEYAQKQIGFQAALRIMAAISFGLLMISLCLFQSREKLENLAKGTLLHGGAFKKAAYCMIVVTSLVMCAGGAAGGTFANSYGKHTFGLTEAQTLPINLIRQGVSIPAAALAAWIAYKCTNCLTISIVITACSAICYFLWIEVASLIGMYMWVFAKGILHGGLGCMISAVITQVVRSEQLFGDTQYLWGARLGMIATFDGIGGLGGPLLFAKLYSLTGGSYVPGQIFCGLCYVIAFIALLILSLTFGRKKATEVEAEP